MAGLDPAIHVLQRRVKYTWIPATSAGMTVERVAPLGDPIADFSYLMLNWHNPADGRAGLLGLDLAALGIPSQDEAVERYVARTGFPVPPMDWYFAYNLFRLAGIMQGIKKRVIEGTASSQHARDMSERVRPLAEKAWDFARKAGA